MCKRRLRRILRAAGLRGLHSPPRRPDRAHNGRTVTDRVDTMWGTDMTEVKTLEGRAYVFVAVDHCSSELVGHHASLLRNLPRGSGAGPHGRFYDIPTYILLMDFSIICFKSIAISIPAGTINEFRYSIFFRLL